MSNLDRSALSGMGYGGKKKEGKDTADNFFKTIMNHFASELKKTQRNPEIAEISHSIET